MIVCRRCAAGVHVICEGLVSTDSGMTPCQCPKPECGRRNSGEVG